MTSFTATPNWFRTPKYDVRHFHHLRDRWHILRASIREPLAVTGDNTGAQPADFNLPYMTSKLVLTHTPASISIDSPMPEQWVLTPDTTPSTPTNGGSIAAQVGTLLKKPTMGPKLLTAGQFRMPFKIVVTRK